MPTLAYAAGAIDGEGHIAIQRRKLVTGYSYGLRITVVNADERLPRWLHEKLGGSLLMNNVRARQPQHSITHSWVASSEHAAEILRLVLPFMVLKAEQAAVAIDFQEHISAGERPGVPLSETEREKRAWYRAWLDAVRSSAVRFEDLPAIPHEELRDAA